MELKETGKTGITEKACVPGTAIKDDPWLQTVTSTNNTHPLLQKIPGKTMTQTCTGMPRSGTLSNNNCDIRMDGEGMDAQIKPGNEVKGTEQQRPQSSGGVYFYVPNALQDETHLTFSPAY